MEKYLLVETSRIFSDVLNNNPRFDVDNLGLGMVLGGLDTAGTVGLEIHKRQLKVTDLNVEASENDNSSGRWRSVGAFLSDGDKYVVEYKINGSKDVSGFGINTGNSGAIDTSLSVGKGVHTFEFTYSDSNTDSDPDNMIFKILGSAAGGYILFDYIEVRKVLHESKGNFLVPVSNIITVTRFNTTDKAYIIPQSSDNNDAVNIQFYNPTNSVDVADSMVEYFNSRIIEVHSKNQNVVDITGTLPNKVINIAIT